MTVTELYHHGILGMRWGKRNGPPYPLDSDDHSATEKKAGWRKSLDKSNNDGHTKEKLRDSERHGLTDGQKKAIKTGVIVAGTLLAAYGAYKLNESGVLDRYMDTGKKMVGSIGDHSIPSKAFTDSANSKIDPKTGLKLLTQSETLENARAVVNPTGSHENCPNVVSAIVGRLCGYDVVAKNGGPMKFDALCQVFGLDPSDETSVRRIRPPAGLDRVTRIIEKRYSEGDVGAIGFGWQDAYKQRTGVDAHTLNWVIHNGKAEFLDGQANIDDQRVRQILGLWLDSSREVSVGKFGNQITGLNPGTDIDLFKKLVG